MQKYNYYTDEIFRNESDKLCNSFPACKGCPFFTSISHYSIGTKCLLCDFSALRNELVNRLQRWSDSHSELSLSEDDIVMLKSLSLRGYNWLARDENDDLYAYTNKPVKIMLGEEGKWDSQKSSCTCIDDYPLSLAKWEDIEPIKIIEILNEQ